MLNSRIIINNLADCLKLMKYNAFNQCNIAHIAFCIAPVNCIGMLEISQGFKFNIFVIRLLAPQSLLLDRNPTFGSLNFSIKDLGFWRISRSTLGIQNPRFALRFCGLTLSRGGGRSTLTALLVASQLWQPVRVFFVATRVSILVVLHVF